MASLKRSRDECTQPSKSLKRVCNNLFQIVATVRDNSSLPEYTGRSSDSKTQGDVPGRCIHKASTSCSLSQPVCCACADKRPQKSSYLRYLDGIGDTRHGSRWMHYCPGCQVNGAAYSLSTDPSKNSMPLNGTKSLPGKIAVTCANERFEIIRSDDLTLDDLKNEVARLMWCNPCQLIFVASDMDLEMGTQSALIDPATFISRIERVHLRRVDEFGLAGDNDHDVDMEDAGDRM